MENIEDNKGIMENIEDNKKIMVCTDPDVLNGNKFCFCCIRNCKHCVLMTKEEYIAFNKLNVNEKQKEE